MDKYIERMWQDMFREKYGISTDTLKKVDNLNIDEIFSWNLVNKVKMFGELFIDIGEGDVNKPILFVSDAENKYKYGFIVNCEHLTDSLITVMYDKFPLANKPFVLYCNEKQFKNLGISRQTPFNSELITSEFPTSFGILIKKWPVNE